MMNPRPLPGPKVPGLVLLVLLTTLPVDAQDSTGPGDPEPNPATVEGLIRPSDSPYLKPPADLKDDPPIQPYDGPPGVPPVDPAAAVIHTVSTGETTVVPSDLVSGSLWEAGPRSAEPFAGVSPPIGTGVDWLSGESIIGSDDRTRVTLTGTYPWRTVVRLRVTWPNGGAGVCSGAIISDYHVLTAGHCIFDYGNTNDWAASVKVFPGLDDDYMPYNYAWATRIHTYTGWTQSGMSEHDWAVLALDRRVGTFTGWMGRRTESSSSSTYTGTLNVAGYPGTPSGNATCPSWANCQYIDSDSGHSANEYNHWYWMDTSGGMSGGPVWVYYSSTVERYILTTHTCGVGGCGIASNNVNHGTRLNSDKFDRISTWISGDSDVAPIDRADLIDDGQAFSGFSPTTIAGGEWFQVWSDVRNVGTASADSFAVAYYASTNTTITTSDYVLGYDFLTESIPPFSWDDSSVAEPFPMGVPDGLYYVGWIVDSGDDVNEFDESNNRAYKTGYRLTVCNLPDTPSLLAPGNGASTTDRTPTLDWSTVSDAGTYRVEVDQSNSFSSPILNTTTSSSNYTPASDLAPGTYYWRVRAKKGCGSDGNWSSVRSFTVTSSTSSCEVTQVSNTTIGTTETHGACNELRVGPSLTVSETGAATLEAGTRVVLYDGFRLQSGGRLTVKTCGHSLCSTGAPLSSGCHSCVAAVCAQDSHCCNNQWDSTCVGAVGNLCGLTCP